MPTLGPLTDAIRDGKREDARRLTEEAIEAAVPVQLILDALIAGMDEVGKRFQCGETFVPGMLVAARAMKETMARLEPLLVGAGRTPAFTTVIGTVQGDLHDRRRGLTTSGGAAVV